MRALLVGTVVVGVLLFVFLYFEAKARAYRGKMEAFAVVSEESVASAPAQDPAAAASGGVFGSSVGPGDDAVDDDHVDAGGESMGIGERRLV
jgi:hypothetical protein